MKQTNKIQYNIKKLKNAKNQTYQIRLLQHIKHKLRTKLKQIKSKSHNDKDNNDCDGKCNNSNCSCPTVHFAFTIPSYAEIKE